MPHSMIRLSTNEIIRKVPCTCVDGRTSGMRYSAAGGSLGLFLTVMNYAEQKGQQIISDDSIRDLIETIARDISPMYLHTDQHALELIYSRMGLSADTKLRALNESQQRSFIELALNADHQGCGHIKLMKKHSDKYGVSSKTVDRVLKQFYLAFFAHAENVLFDVLEGHHEEEQVLIIEQQKSMDLPNETVLILENRQDGQQFFCHRPLKRELIRRFSGLLAEKGIYPFEDTDIAQIAKSHNHQAETTLECLAGDLEIKSIDL